MQKHMPTGFVGHATLHIRGPINVIVNFNDHSASPSRARQLETFYLREVTING